jgi:nucleoid-associated protein YgaU
MADKKPDFGNVIGGSSSTARPGPQAPASTPTKTYTVQAGDSLWKIAKHFYGKGSPGRVFTRPTRTRSTIPISFNRAGR